MKTSSITATALRAECMEVWDTPAPTMRGLCLKALALVFIDLYGRTLPSSLQLLFPMCSKFLAKPEL